YGDIWRTTCEGTGKAQMDTTGALRHHPGPRTMARTPQEEMMRIRVWIGSLMIALLVSGSLAVVSPAEGAHRRWHGRHWGWHHGRHWGWYHGRPRGWYHRRPFGLHHGRPFRGGWHHGPHRGLGPRW